MRANPRDRKRVKTRFNYAELRIHAVKHAGKGDDLADVFGAANPGDGALQAHAKARMRHAAVAPQVQVPLEGFLRQIVFAQALNQQIVVVDALAAADDFAVALLARACRTPGPGRAARRRAACRRL